MEPAPADTLPRLPVRERPGWLAIALIAIFVFAAIALFLVGAHLVRCTPGPDLSAIALVPLPGDPSNGSLSAHFTDGLSLALSRNASLRLVNRSSAGALLEGGVQPSGNKLRVTARLVRSAGGNLLWSHTYEFASEEAPAVQDRIAHDVAGVLQIYRHVPAF
jgi:TolB-like protein